MSDESQQSRRSRILIVDDDRVFCDILQSWLSASHDLQVANDGEEALQRVRDWHPDLVLLDVMMPKLSGFSVAWVLRNDPRYEGVSVIFMTAHSASMPDAEKKLARADDKLLKPFSLDHLNAVLARHLPEALMDLGFTVPSETETRPEDRRLSPRREMDFEVRMQLDSQEGSGRLRSLSHFGAFVECELEPSSGTTGKMIFEARGVRFEGGCEVVYAALHRGRRGIGIQFFELTHEEESLVDELVTEPTNLES